MKKNVNLLVDKQYSKKRLDIFISSKITDLSRTRAKNLILDGNGKLEFSIHEKKERNWRSDPKDGLRPLLKERKK